MRTGHHDFGVLVAARNLRHGVPRQRRFAMELRRDVDRQLHLLVAFEQAEDALVRLDRHHERRHAQGLARNPLSAATPDPHHSVLE